MTADLSIGVAQTVAAAGDVEGNLHQHLELAELAATEGVEVLAFPELSLTGYELGLAEELAFAADDKRLDPLSRSASTLGITLVVGAPARSGTRLHIAAFILCPSGRIDVYTKMNLGAFSDSAAVDGSVPPPEASVFAPGDLNPALHLASAMGALAVCADTGRPDHSQRAADAGASIYLAGMFVIPSDHKAEVANLRSITTRHGMAVAFANYGGPTGGLRSAGGSAIWSERGDLVAQLGSEGVGVATAHRIGGRWQGAVL